MNSELVVVRENSISLDIINPRSHMIPDTIDIEEFHRSDIQLIKAAIVASLHHFSVVFVSSLPNPPQSSLIPQIVVAGTMTTIQELPDRNWYMLDNEYQRLIKHN